jgi:large subunit ribosomal protein L5
MATALQTQYKEQVVPALMKQFGYSSVMQVPRLTKVVLNIGYGKNTKDKTFIEHVEKTMTAISGQKPVHTKAKKSISNFKIRQGQPIGITVTLRGERMQEFLYKFIHIALPRVRDFRGISKKSMDAHGNYTVGLKEQIAFPEVTADLADRFYGLEITIVTTAKSKEEGLALLTAIGMPFRDK